ncbi:MAG: hypothetical protein EZS28_005683 [Streblomastix strix]|uniref:Reverse transcriptase domain-containing protein n=1 Tax=Streblomastix strix TaxID=222440 RepID=A0A5J4WWB1_9EUKA|nr:MAG: hypothetical protein EZS28_005683 [Streblomastix strix]
MDQATSLDLKSAFHRIVVFSNSILQTALNFISNNYTCKAAPFGIEHCTIFFEEAIKSILRQIRIHSEIKILNYCDDILLIQQDKQIFKIKNRNYENIGIVRMYNINSEVRSRTEIDNNIPGMDMEPERNEYKNVRRKQVENDICIEGLVPHNTQEQKREDKITSSANRQIELSETSDKRSVSVSNRIRQSEDTSVKNGIMGWSNDSERSSNKRIEMVVKENRGQPTRIIDQQDNNMHVNNRCITTRLGSDADLRKLDRTYSTRLLERKGSGNDKQRQSNQCYLLRATPFRASLQEDARSGSLDTFRQHNSSQRCWEMESEGIPDRKNKASILSSEKTLTINHNNLHPRETDLDNRFTLETVQIKRLLTEGRNDTYYKQVLEPGFFQRVLYGVALLQTL